MCPLSRYFLLLLRSAVYSHQEHHHHNFQASQVPGYLQLDRYEITSVGKDQAISREWGCGVGVWGREIQLALYAHHLMLLRVRCGLLKAWDRNTPEVANMS